MEILKQRQGAVTVLKPVGPLTGAESAQVKAELLRALATSLGRTALDMSGVPFIDSRGLEVLVEVGEEMNDSGQSLRLCAASKTVREVLELTELAPLFEHFEDVNAAARSFL